MSPSIRLSAFFGLGLAALAPAQSLGPKLYSEMHWRSIGPTRAGRARAVAGVPGQPNVAYIGFDNGGVWRSTDYGSTWVPLFDHETTGSIGAIAVAPSNPNIVYVGTGAGIIRPDLAVGDGIYRSTDAGKTWVHLGLRDTQMIANIDVDPRDPTRLFVAALGHPYGPNSERGIFRSTDGGATFEKVLFKDDYTSANDVRIDPRNPGVVYAALWQQQQGFYENGAFGGSSGGIFKSTDGGSTWKQLTNGLPAVIQANLAMAPSNPNLIYAMVASPAGAGGAGRGGRGGAAGSVAFYKTTDGGDHWALTAHSQDPRPLLRIGGGDLPTITVDPKNENVVYSCSIVFWRTEDGGVTWSAVRGAPGGDDYQKSWINPENPNIILLVSDQGGVISANGGESWSNWYTQPTGAMYHVTADNAFPYRLCSGQQDSGSACVDSRGMDGEITFHDWHPVDIEEYGMAAPDPKNPDLVYGGKVSRYNRATGQVTGIGPVRGGRGAPAATVPGEPPARTVRTQPLIWSPKDLNILYFATAGVWKTVNGGHSWTPISGDLTRQTWDVPANAGKYASTVTPSPLGTVTAIAPSPLDVNVLWAGTGDGLIQVTTNGGAKWTNVTPPEIKAWTRIFNMDAGHFDTKTAYAAANTLRLDDMNPHFWRTHDGGKTWTEIDNGIEGGAVANSIREDPRKKGLLYAATDTQVWVSFDDGDSWHSLRLDMPAISVRDIAVKDDASCLCSDLVAGTHGRGFWILDDVTPLRQAAAAAAASSAYLFKPATALRVRFDTNDPTPWPPEWPAGENPPAGAVIDYYLPSAAGEVRLEILNTQGKVVRTYSSTDPVMNPDPATDPVAYNKICQKNPTAPDCALPLYWPAPQEVLKTSAGMHRFTWDMHYDPIPGSAGGGRGGGGGNGAVPHRTYPSVNSPWAAPGQYSVRLIANGQTLTQPITVKMDPRVKITPEVQQIFTLTTQMEDRARAAEAAYAEARALAGKLRARPQSAATDALIKQVEEIAPERAARQSGGRGGRGGFGAAAVPAPPPNLANIGAQLVAAVMGMQASEMPPTAAELRACSRQEAAYTALMAKWAALKTKAR
ncbi:MAG: WD40/YVTN/BNR-like repeat-containing protein [Bryobacteraceae bacterium]